MADKRIRYDNTLLHKDKDLSTSAFLQIRPWENQREPLHNVAFGKQFFMTVGEMSDTHEPFIPAECASSTAGSLWHSPCFASLSEHLTHNSKAWSVVVHFAPCGQLTWSQQTRQCTSTAENCRDLISTDQVVHIYSWKLSPPGHHRISCIIKGAPFFYKLFWLFM